MIKTLNLDGVGEVKMSSSGAFALRYKAQFRRDPIADILTLAEVQSDPAKMDTEVLYHVAWALIKNATPEIPEPLEYFGQFEAFPILDEGVLDAIVDLALFSMQSSTELKKK